MQKLYACPKKLRGKFGEEGCFTASNSYIII